jgi:hypothetical protein
MSGAAIKQRDKRLLVKRLGGRGLPFDKRRHGERIKLAVLRALFIVARPDFSGLPALVKRCSRVAVPLDPCRALLLVLSPRKRSRPRRCMASLQKAPSPTGVLAQRRADCTTRDAACDGASSLGHAFRRRYFALRTFAAPVLSHL